MFGVSRMTAKKWRWVWGPSGVGLQEGVDKFGAEIHDFAHGDKAVHVGEDLHSAVLHDTLAHALKQLLTWTERERRVRNIQSRLGVEEQ